MGIEDQAPTAAYEPVEIEPPAPTTLPSWADESTVAVPLAELFPEDGEE